MRWRVFFCYASDHAQFIGSTVRNTDRKSTRLNSSHLVISYAVFCLKKKKILRQILCRAVTRREAIGEVIDAARILAHDLGPRLLVTLETTLNQFRIGCCQRKYRYQLSPSRKPEYRCPPTR